MPIMSDADSLMAWLKADIESRGGTGRRLGRLSWDGPDWAIDRDRLRAAIMSLVDSGQCRLEEVTDFGFIYLMPNA